MHGCIFVCFRALLQFVCTQGATKEIWSDNGTNFVAREKEIRLAVKGWNQKAIIEAMHERGVEWHSQALKKWCFQPPTASHNSRVWERLIQSVCKTMKAVCDNVKCETLHTVFAEAAGILNS